MSNCLEACMDSNCLEICMDSDCDCCSPHKPSWQIHWPSIVEYVSVSLLLSVVVYWLYHLFAQSN